MSDLHLQREFARSFEECQHELLAYILTMVPRYADALDLLQESAAAMWANYADYEPRCAFVFWARKYAHIQVLKYRKSERYRSWMLNPFDEQTIEVLATAHQQHGGVLGLYDDALANCLEKLTEAEYELLHHRYWKDSNLRNLAASQGLSEHQIYRRLQAIRHLLRECVELQIAEWGEEA